MRQLHRIVGASLAVVFVMLALTGLFLRHESLARRVLGDVSRPRGALAERTTALAADPFRQGHFLAGTASGLYATGDGGATWRDVRLPVPTTDVVALAFAPHDSALVLVATAAGGVFLSNDGGDVWDDAELPTEARESHVQSATFTRDGTLLVRTGSGLLARTGTGEWMEWQQVAHGANSGTMRLLLDLHAGRWPAPLIGVLIDVAAIGVLVLVFSGLMIIARRQERRSNLLKR